MNEQTCPDCRGTGVQWINELQDIDMCERCDGTGVIERTIGNEKLTKKELSYE